MGKFDFKHLFDTNISDDSGFINPDLDFYRAINYEGHDFKHEIKLHFRIFKKKLRTYLRRKKEDGFTNILFVTPDCPIYTPKSDRLDSPIDYIVEIQKQYPDIKTNVLIPLLGLNEDLKSYKKLKFENEGHFFEFEKTSADFEIFVQNKIYKVIIYKYIDDSNITIYGLYSPAFSFVKTPKELMSFQNAIAFMRAVRMSVKYLSKDGFKPDIIHAERIPFFLGSEFEPKFSDDIKVLQVVEDLIKQDTEKQEPFWAFLNIADKQNMKKLYKDDYIFRCFSILFNTSPEEMLVRFSESIDLIYQNYAIFHKITSENSDNIGDIIFKRLNDRIEKMYPNFIKKGLKYYYPISGTLNNADFWITSSKTYYNDLYEKNLAPEEIMKLAVKNVEKSSYVIPTIDVESYLNKFGRSVYYNFNSDNYREERIKNKKTLIKEFSSDSIKSQFIDKTLFRNETAKIYGYLDTFYNAPLIFANPGADTFGEGLDIFFNTLMKLFERNKNFQIIISIKDGMKEEYVKSVINFLYENKIYMGRWVFIEGEINLPKFFAGADIYSATSRTLNLNMKHQLGMHYGCIPVVPASGIYNDTVIDIYDDISEGNGFKTKNSLMNETEETNVYIDTLTKALEVCENNPSGWNIIIKNCLMTKINWDFNKLERYNRIYHEIL